MDEHKKCIEFQSKTFSNFEEDWQKPDYICGHRTYSQNSFEGFFFIKHLPIQKKEFTLEQASEWRILLFNVSNLNLWTASLDDLRHQYSGINHIQELKCIPIDHNQRGDDAIHFVPCLVKLTFIRFFKLLMPSRNVGKLIATTTKCYCYETSKHKIK